MHRGGAWLLSTATKLELRRTLASAGLRLASHLPFEDKLKAEAPSRKRELENYDGRRVIYCKIRPR